MPREIDFFCILFSLRELARIFHHAENVWVFMYWEKLRKWLAQVLVGQASACRV
jgi:hypothetical protein